MQHTVRPLELYSRIALIAALALPCACNTRWFHEFVIDTAPPLDPWMKAVGDLRRDARRCRRQRIPARLVSTLAGWPTLISPAAVLGSLLFSGAVGVFFGFHPARKAARLDPIVALRVE